jgi:hypothetical protein
MRPDRPMKRILLSTISLAAALLLGALAAPGLAAAAGPITTSSSCTGTTTVTCDLYAEKGTLALPGTTPVPVWGFATTSGGAPSIPGPAIVVEQGAAVTVNLSNHLGRDTSLTFEGLQAVPDLTPLADGASRAYSFTAGEPGTYLYEAGVLSDAQYQASMGLHGILVVRPSGAPGQAYGASTAFADEAAVVVSEIDPALNRSTTPWTFDLRAFAPKYFLVNGAPYTASAPSISIAGDSTTLLRMVNAGIQHHSLGLLGLHGRVVAADGSVLPAERMVVAETIAPGQTADVLVDLPLTTGTTLYPLYDASMLLNNSNANGVGGMLALLAATGGAPVDTTGPVTSAVTVDANSGAIGATVTDAASNVAAAEYYLDTTGAPGTGTAMTGAFGTPSVAVSATIPPATLAGLTTGAHTVYVRGQDDAGNWGALASTSFDVDQDGPEVSGLTLTPDPSNGSVSVAIAGTASDVARGGSSVTAAEFFIGAPGADGSGTALTLNTVATVVSLSGTLASPVAATQISVHALDAAGNWGPYATITPAIDATGPATSGLAANPPATNGTFGQSSGNPTVRVTATLDDTASGGSKITAGEGFIDTAGAAGSGFPFVATDGTWNGVIETVYADIPLTTLNQLSSGNHTILVRGKDAAGSWGATASLTYLIDRTAPTFTGISLAAINPTNGGGITLTVNGAADPGGALASGIAGGEYWIDTTTTTTGTGTPFTGTGPTTIAQTISTGTHTVRVHIRDVAGNWSTNIASGTVSTTAVSIFSNGFDTGGGNWGWSSRSTTNTGRMNVTTTTVLNGTRSLQAQGNNTNYVQFNYGTTANPAWLSFDGRFLFRPNGNASTGQDILTLASNTNYNAANILARVRYRLDAGTPQVQLQAGSTNANAAWVNLAAGTNTIEVVWQAVGSAGPGPGTLVLYLNGSATPAQSLATTATAAARTLRLGSVTSGGSSTLEYFDAFASKRSVVALYGNP